VGISVGSSEVADCDRTIGWGAVDDESEDKVESIETVRWTAGETGTLRAAAVEGGETMAGDAPKEVSAAWEVRRRRAVSSGLVLKGGCPCRGLKGGELLRVGDGDDDDGSGRSCAAFTAPWVVGRVAAGS